MISQIKDFWVAGWRSDPVAFVYEMISFVFVVGASMALAINAQDPKLEFIYPAFLIGSVTGMYAYYRRQLIWPTMLTFYFVLVNIFGFGRAIGWW